MTPSAIWHAYPLGLLGADQSGADRGCQRSLAALEDWLPHVTSLGVDTVLLGPLFSSTSHGYDTIDHRTVDERIGTNTDLERFIDVASRHGVGVVLDGVFAFAGRDFWRLSEPDELSNPWFARDEAGEFVPWRVSSLVTPSYGSAGYQAYVADVMTAWLDRGVVGWRLDSAWSVPLAFWRRVLARVRTKHPKAWFVGQSFDDDVPVAINSSSWTTATEYALMHGLRDWLAGGDPELALAAIQLHARNSVDHTMYTFVGNHDFARLADVLPADRAAASFAVLMTLPGIPAIYYGDEIALSAPAWMQGGSDHLLRPALQPGEMASLDAEQVSLLEAVRGLGRLRRDHAWVRTAQVSQLTIASGVLTYQVHSPEGALHVKVHPESAATGDGHDELNGCIIMSGAGWTITAINPSRDESSLLWSR